MKNLAPIVLLASLFLAIAPVPVSADLLQDVKAKGQLVCGIGSDNAPYGFPDPKTREIVGFEVDICVYIAKELGVKYVPISITAEARIPELTLGRVDIVAATLGYTKERAQQIDYTHSHYQNAIRVIVKTSSGITTFAQLNGKKVSATQGSTPEQVLRRRIPGATILTYISSPTAFLALQQDKVFGFAVTQMTAYRFMLEAAPGEMRYIEEPLGFEVSALGVRKGQPAFLAEVNRILMLMEQSGEYGRIWDKWCGPNTPFNIPRQKVTPIDQAVSQ